MVKVQAGKHNYYLDGYLKANLDHLKKQVRKDFDGFVLVVGREGFGKSTIASQMAMYCDPTYNLDRCVFTAEQFIEAVTTADRYQAVVFDETMGYLSSRQNMSKFNRSLIKIMSEMRSRNLIVFLCIPNYFMMDWYVALHRTTGLIYTYQRTRFGSYDYATKKKLYMKGKRYHSYSVSPNFIGVFTKYFTLDKIKYDEKKQEAIKQSTKDVRFDSQWKEQRDTIINSCVVNKYYSIKQLSDLLGLSIRQIQRICHDIEGGLYKYT